MSRLIDRKSFSIKDSGSILAFETAGSGHWSEWDRYLTIDDQRAFLIGNICGTCEFFFERLDGVSQGVSPREVSKALQNGVSKLDVDLVSKVSSILPEGDYEVSLLELKPKLIVPGTDEDYFTNEQVHVWGIDSFEGLPHHPKIKYYRSSEKELNSKSKLFEFVVPTFPVSWLDDDTIDKYRSLISDDRKPTALCLSVLDIKEPSDYGNHVDHLEHWCLTHYIVDGHHKVFSASLLDQSITMLSFLAKGEGISNDEDIEALFRNL